MIQVWQEQTLKLIQAKDLQVGEEVVCGNQLGAESAQCRSLTLRDVESGSYTMNYY